MCDWPINWLFDRSIEWAEAASLLQDPRSTNHKNLLSKGPDKAIIQQTTTCCHQQILLSKAHMRSRGASLREVEGFFWPLRFLKLASIDRLSRPASR